MGLKSTASTASALDGLGQYANSPGNRAAFRLKSHSTTPKVK